MRVIADMNCLLYMDTAKFLKDNYQFPWGRISEQCDFVNFLSFLLFSILNTCYHSNKKSYFITIVPLLRNAMKPWILKLFFCLQVTFFIVGKDNINVRSLLIFQGGYSIKGNDPVRMSFLTALAHKAVPVLNKGVNFLLSCALTRAPFFNMFFTTEASV